MSRSSDRGAAAVELALVLPLLLTILVGIIDFGFAFNAKIAVTQAAREGARVIALQGTTAQASSRVTDALTNSGQTMAVSTSVVSACTSSTSTTATVQVSGTVATILPIPNITVTARGVMQCEG